MMTMQNTQKTFATTSKKLENFLYSHRINWKYQTRTEYDEAEWHYDDTPSLRNAVEEFKQIVRDSRC